MLGREQCPIGRTELQPDARLTGGRIGLKLGDGERDVLTDYARRHSIPLSEAALDFSQCGEFADYGIAVLATALQEVPKKHIQFVGLRQHQARLFKYFGVDMGGPISEAQEETTPLAAAVLAAREVA